MYLKSIHKKLDAKVVGGKAANLSRMVEYGVEVPPGFAISKELLIFFKRKNALPPDFSKDLKSKLKEFKSEELIVRSSAIGEDSGTHSFAGQLDSIVVANNFDEVKSAILKCWEGLRNERVLAYQEVTGQDLKEMGLVIQEYLKADYSGVTFTQSPSNPKEIYSEFVAGPGEQLVSGKVSPRNFSSPSGESKKEQLPFDAQRLIKASLKLKREYGCELDIEWVAIGDKIYFVQARPITVSLKSKVHWTNTNLNENYPDPISPLLYSIARDSYYHYFKNIAKLIQIHPKAIRELEYDFSNSVGIWGNRIYYNMTSIHNILSSSSLKDYFKEAFNQFVGYGKKDVASVKGSKRSSLLKLMSRLILLNRKLESHVVDIETKVSDFSKKVDKLNNPEDNATLFYEFLDLRFNEWYHASLADFFSMIHYKLLGKFTQKYYGEESIGVHNILIQAIPGLISSEPLNDLWDLTKEIEKMEGGRNFFLNHEPEFVLLTLRNESKWSDVNGKVQSYLGKWGFRCSGELMFFKNNYIEEPARLIELMQSYMKNEAQDPRAVIKTKAEERIQTSRKFALKIIKKRHILLPWTLFDLARLYLIIKLCKQAISSRERVRYKQAEMYYKFKILNRAIAKRAVSKGLLDKVDDIFFLTYKEIGELVSSSYGVGFKQIIVDRKQAFSKESEKEFPEHFSCNFGERPDSIEREINFEKGAKEFSGLAASGGRIKSRIKVLESVLEGGKIEKGDILVTKQTDPGWVMVFPLIGGLIVERGGALSHGAIVAREFGIPAVVGVKNITRILKDNDEVILDGDLGKIQIIQHDS